MHMVFFLFSSVYGFHILILVWDFIWSESFHYGQKEKKKKRNRHKELDLGLMSLREESTLRITWYYVWFLTNRREVWDLTVEDEKKTSINFVSGNQWFEFQSFLGASLFFISLSGLRNKLPIYFVIWFTGCWFEVQGQEVNSLSLKILLRVRIV